MFWLFKTIGCLQYINFSPSLFSFFRPFLLMPVTWLNLPKIIKLDAVLKNIVLMMLRHVITISWHYISEAMVLRDGVGLAIYLTIVIQ